MEMRQKRQKFSEAGAPRRSQIKSVLAVLSINDTLIKKHLFVHGKFIAGKSQQCQNRNRFQGSFRVFLDGHQKRSAVCRADY